MATTVGSEEEEVPESVVTNPVMARQIRGLFVCYSLAVIAMFAYVAYSHFRIDGPLWEAFAWTAGEAPLFLIHLCMVPWLRDIFIRTYAQVPSSDSTGSDDLSSNLLVGPENV
ncbi:unnamed protein product [Miscanthus lutarioriparius]|uniref:Uncharacterized protein n=1 Tax=Miscanthus lutarioriparius TaxID=422564 RepID=A0A811QNX0_9POAL|nr:unnamed protein product [Miscanthus lutarioriparius]